VSLETGKGAVALSQEQARIIVQVQPNARQNEVVAFENGVLHIKVAAPPVKGKANKELIGFLSRLFDISKTRVAIEKGETSRRKVIAITGLNQTQILERLRGSGW
jgi:uncharacterized protein (TIGR00251 family)